MGHVNENTEFQPLNIAVLTVSDTRTRDTDGSGDTLKQRLESYGHRLYARSLQPDSVYRIRAELSYWIADPRVQVILVTGGTGFTTRDMTPEAVLPLLDREITGYGELFRQLSYSEIGTSTIQSRTVAGIANNTLIFTMPGSPSACRTAWDQLISEQLDARHRPCNFVAMVLPERAPACRSRQLFEV